ncbi:hypothetical protein EVAR_54525_1 [Eumeta japonica]|uniref:Uncharacterized protein n=1 Tax=Eumeta variegata TaxID=151549 RepID=A0A4C1YKP2_EUMVA|nr:hypothetical protein EVAR_54525_1 [Eumeta japonica]
MDFEVRLEGPSEYLKPILTRTYDKRRAKCSALKKSAALEAAIRPCASHSRSCARAGLSSGTIVAAVFGVVAKGDRRARRVSEHRSIARTVRPILNVQYLTSSAIEVDSLVFIRVTAPLLSCPVSTASPLRRILTRTFYMGSGRSDLKPSAPARCGLLTC